MKLKNAMVAPGLAEAFEIWTVLHQARVCRFLLVELLHFNFFPLIWSFVDLHRQAPLTRFRVVRNVHS